MKLVISTHGNVENVTTVKNPYAMYFIQGINAGITMVGKLLLPAVDMNGLTSVLYNELETSLTPERLRELILEFDGTEKLADEDLDLYRSEDVVSTYGREYTAAFLRDLQQYVKANPDIAVKDLLFEYKKYKKDKPIIVKLRKPEEEKAPEAPKPTTVVTVPDKTKFNFMIGDIVAPLGDDYEHTKASTGYMGIVTNFTAESMLVCGIFSNAKDFDHTTCQFQVNPRLFVYYKPTPAQLALYSAYVTESMNAKVNELACKRTLRMLEEKSAPVPALPAAKDSDSCASSLCLCGFRIGDLVTPSDTMKTGVLRDDSFVGIISEIKGGELTVHGVYSDSLDYAIATGTYTIKPVFVKKIDFTDKQIDECIVYVTTSQTAKLNYDGCTIALKLLNNYKERRK